MSNPLDYPGPEDRRERNDPRLLADEWLDATFALLANRRRRFVLSYLRDCRESTLLELAGVVAGWEQASGGGGVAPSAERDRIAARLHHVDLPRLAATGTIAYDDQRKRIEILDLPPPIADLLVVGADYRRSDESNRDRSTTGRRRR